MSDRLLKETEYSLAYKLNNISGVIGPVIIASPDFNWDRKQDNQKRNTPFAVVRFIGEIDQFAFIDGGASIDPEMNFIITVCETNFTRLRTSIGAIQSCLRTSTTLVSGANIYIDNYYGIPLVDSQNGDRVVGGLNLEQNDLIGDYTHDDKSTWDNLKYSCHIPVKLTPIYKDVNKDLL